ncbi:MAG: hypothetical protein MJ082_03770, partial [Clostridia bacterium]|nr:hypothetical protein [Clostridia bacterium]
FAFMLTFLFSLGVTATEEQGINSLDFSGIAGASVSLDAAEFLENVIGLTLTDAERAYLSSIADAFSYDNRISTRYVTNLYDAEEHTLTCLAQTYSYLAGNGVTVAFVPTSFTLGNMTIPSTTSGNGGSAVFSGVTYDESLSVSVLYSATFTLPASCVNPLLTAAYSAAVAEETNQAERIAAYPAEHAAWERATEDYARFLAEMDVYNVKYAAYEAYLSILRDYTDENELYLAYLHALEEYDADLLSYHAYSEAKETYRIAYEDYLAYVAEKEAYPAKLAQYREYVAKVDAIEHQLAGLDLIFTPMTDNRTFYDAVMGGTVDAVFENKSLIVQSGANAGDVDAAAIATKNLRILMSEYKSLQTLPEKYNYYTVNYEKFRDNFISLLRALDSLYRNPKVRGMAIQKEKDKKYVILLAQLVLLSNNLNDGAVLDPSGNPYTENTKWRLRDDFDEGTSVGKILGFKIYYDDTDTAAPIFDGYPSEVSEPILPAEVAKPVSPAHVPEPTLPEPVTEPTAPAPVEKPIHPTVTEDPGAEPTLYVSPSLLADLIAERENGILQERSPITEDISYTVTSTVAKPVFRSSEVTLIFFLTKGGEEAYRTTVESGTYAEYLGTVPSRVSDEIGDYTFSGWETESGELFSLDAPTTDAILYPHFTCIYRSYTVTWVNHGGTVSENAFYGTVPTPPEVPETYVEGDYIYSFASYDKPISAVMEDVTYTAQYTVSPIVPLSDGCAKITNDGEKYTVDLSESQSKSVPLSDLLPLLPEDASLSVMLRKGNIAFPRTEVRKLKDAGASELILNVAKKLDGGTSISLSVVSDSTVTVRGTFTAAVPAPDMTYARLSVPSESGEVYQKLSLTEDVYSFPITSGTAYSLNFVYQITSIVPGDVEFSLSSENAKAGERVTISYTLPRGYSLSKCFFVGEDSVEVPIINGAFTMPDCPVEIVLMTERTAYRVTFISEGKILKEDSYFLDELPTPPPSPKKASDYDYVYSFVGWSPLISEVTGDTVYTAFYQRSAVDHAPEPFLVLSDSVMRILILGVIALLVFFIGTVTAVILLVRRRKKAKRK